MFVGVIGLCLFSVLALLMVGVVRFFTTVVFLEISIFLLGGCMLSLFGGGVLLLFLLMVSASVLCVCFSLVPFFFRDVSMMSTVL